jgi:hypothetical protein
MIRALRSHPVATASGAVALLGALAWLAFGFFGVHTLFIDEQVSEAAPVFDAPAPAPVTPAAQPDAPDTSDTFTLPANVWPAETDPPGQGEGVAAPPVTTAPAAPATQPAAPAAPGEIATEFAGDFRSLDHPTSGRAVVLGNGTGQRFLRFEDFETDNGPDLNVYLVNSSTGDVSDYVDLGDLRGNVGEQNYEIPEGVDLSVYDTVVIWCVRFSSPFGDALLQPV